MSEERTATVDDNKSTFLLTNILPQKPDLNQGVWLKFEIYCNDLARK
jgi:endonuclease G, mitochondrial